jgi:2',3'-cyclic-nucleotide 2'-phosphodiesterase
MRIFMIGDVYGAPGKDIVQRRLGDFRRERKVDFVVANVENLSGGAGILPEDAAALFEAGVDVMTSGNHAFDKREVIEFMATETRLLRPANYPDGVPGRGLWIGDAKWGVSIAVINVMGRVNLPRTDCQFRKADEALRVIGNRADVILVDHHAEATSEKLAFGRHLDGRVSAVVGTHTHVQTADEEVLPGGAAYITDLGMTGAHAGVIGMDAGRSIERFLTGVSSRSIGAEGDVRLNGAIIDVNPHTRQANAISRVSLRGL